MLAQTKITDWLMVFITLVYVIATILICISNSKSAKAAQSQIIESKRQFDEARRLQVIPYLQFYVDDGKVDETGRILCPYTIFEITDTKNTEVAEKVYHLRFTNIGNGMVHHTKVRWNSAYKKDDGYPAEDIVIPPSGSWEINGLFKAHKNGSDNPQDAEIARCTIEVDFADLLGNKYSQLVKLVFLMQNSEVRLIHYNIDSPLYKTQTSGEAVN